MEIIMKPFKIILSFVVSIILSFATMAEDKMEMYSYATYFNCDVELEPAADKEVKTNYAPIYDAAVKDGTIKGWGWLAHHTGGQWRRILYHTATSVQGLFDAQDKMAKKFDAAFGKTFDALSKGCRSHEDYIWKYEAGSPLVKNSSRGKASMSVYMVCDFNNEDKADEIVKTKFAPIYNSFVGKGKLTSWGWMSHIIGGEYRKLATMSAENYEDLLKARAGILQTLFDGKGNKAGKEFSEICGSHQDYLWDIKIESR